MASTRDSIPEYLQPIEGLGHGISAFLATYVILVIAWFVEAGLAGATTNFLGLFHRGLEFTYIAHLGIPGGPLVLNGEPTIVPFIVYALVPAIILFYHGGRIAMKTERSTLGTAFAAGGSVVTGYLLAIALSTPALNLFAEIMFQLVPSLPASQSPGYYAGGWLLLLLVAGLVYPILLGGLGGSLVYSLRDR